MPKSFYSRDPARVARDLLGKILVRHTDTSSLEGVIVETEAYYGSEDPASRAYKGKKNYNRLMWSEPGRVFIYNVHNNWMLNIIAHEPRKIGAVLIRAIEPLMGIESMRRNRRARRIFDLTSGPGKLTAALGIDKSLNGIYVTSDESDVLILENEVKFEIGSSHRIGVKKDLERELRFYMKGNKFVSR